jgi:hypothetical protein
MNKRHRLSESAGAIECVKHRLQSDSRAQTMATEVQEDLNAIPQVGRNQST